MLVDDWVPHYGALYNTIFAKVQKVNKSTWMVILEKAFAKVYGNYAQLIGGWASRGVNTLTGFPSVEVYHSNLTNDEIWNKLSGYDAENAIMTSASNYSTSGDTQKNEHGIAYSHAYTTLGVASI